MDINIDDYINEEEKEAIVKRIFETEMREQAKEFVKAYHIRSSVVNAVCSQVVHDETAKLRDSITPEIMHIIEREISLCGDKQLRLGSEDEQCGDRYSRFESPVLYGIDKAVQEITQEYTANNRDDIKSRIHEILDSFTDDKIVKYTSNQFIRMVESRLNIYGLLQEVIRERVVTLKNEDPDYQALLAAAQATKVPDIE